MLRRSDRCSRRVSETQPTEPGPDPRESSCSSRCGSASPRWWPELPGVGHALHAYLSSGPGGRPGPAGLLAAARHGPVRQARRCRGRRHRRAAGGLGHVGLATRSRPTGTCSPCRMPGPADRRRTAGSPRPGAGRHEANSFTAQRVSLSDASDHLRGLPRLGFPDNRLDACPQAAIRSLTEAMGTSAGSSTVISSPSDLDRISSRTRYGTRPSTARVPVGGQEADEGPAMSAPGATSPRPKTPDLRRAPTSSA